MKLKVEKDEKNEQSMQNNIWKNIWAAWRREPESAACLIKRIMSQEVRVMHFYWCSWFNRPVYLHDIIDLYRSPPQFSSTSSRKVLEVLWNGLGWSWKDKKSIGKVEPMFKAKL